MTKENGISKINYLSFENIKLIYEEFSRVSKKMDEPVPDWQLVNESEVRNLSILPQTIFYGTEQYPTFLSKAAILFYKINKGHVFPNGNKRMSVICLASFLFINGKKLSATSEEARDKALELANSDAKHFDSVKIELENWIREHITDGG